MTKERPYEKYVLLFISIISVVIGILVLTNIINPQYKSGEVIDSNMRILMGAIFVLCGFFSGFTAIKEIIKSHNIKNYSVYFKFINEYSLDKIKQYFISHDLDKDKVYLDSSDEEGTTIGYKHLFGEFTCYISKEEVNICYEYLDEYYEKKTEEEIANLPLMNDEVKFSSLKVDGNYILEQFVSFIKINEIKLEGLE